jgi:hypothetical protein
MHIRNPLSLFRSTQAAMTDHLFLSLNVRVRCVQMCRARTEKVPLGLVLQGQRVSPAMTSMVECHGDDTMDLHRTGQLVIKEGSGATTLDIQVLGSIMGTSTALLIDATG